MSATAPQLLLPSDMFIFQPLERARTSQPTPSVSDWSTEKAAVNCSGGMSRWADIPRHAEVSVSIDGALPLLSWASNRCMGED